MASTWDFLGLAIEADWLEAWATVVGAFGATGALLYAAAGLRHERKARRAENKQLNEERDLARQAQARSIVIHDDRTDHAHPVPEGAQAGEPRVYRATVGNYGEYPVTAVVVSLHSGEGDEAAGFPKWFPVIRAGEAVNVEWPILPKPPKSLGGGILDDVHRVDIMFADIHGLYWKASQFRLAYKFDPRSYGNAVKEAIRRGDAKVSRPSDSADS